MRRVWRAGGAHDRALCQLQRRLALVPVIVLRRAVLDHHRLVAVLASLLSDGRSDEDDDDGTDHRNTPSVAVPVWVLHALARVRPAAVGHSGFQAPPRPCYLKVAPVTSIIGSMPTVPRDQQMLQERIQGSTLQAIGDRHGGLTPEGVRVIVAREGKAQIDDLERRLRALTGDEVEAMLIPGHGGPDFDAALAYMRWSLAELAARGIETHIQYRVTRNGVAFGVSIAENAEGDS